MKGNQWSLVVFTVFIQLAVGLFFVFGSAHFYLSDSLNKIQLDFFAKITSFSVVFLTVIGMITSLLHLGIPKNAFRTLSNLGSSWLSAEILFTLLFCSIAIVNCGLLWSGMVVAGLSSIVFWVGSITGLSLVLVMANVYRLKTIPTWSSLATLFSFFKTTLLTGLFAATLIVQLVMLITLGDDATTPIASRNAILAWVIAIVVVILGVDIMVLLRNATSEKGAPTYSKRMVFQGKARKQKRLFYKLLFNIAGLILCSIPLLFNSPVPAILELTVTLIGMAFVSFMISELIERKIFYDSFEKAGY